MDLNNIYQHSQRHLLGLFRDFGLTDFWNKTDGFQNFLFARYINETDGSLDDDSSMITLLNLVSVFVV